MELDRLRLRQIAGPGAWRTLQALLDDDRAMTQAELALKVDRTQPAVSRALGALSRAQLVTSTPDRQGSLGRPARRWKANREECARLLRGG